MRLCVTCVRACACYDMLIRPSLHISICSVDLDSSPNVSPDDVQFLKKMAVDVAFFSDAVTLLSSLNRSFIDEQKLTWRYLSNITQRFVAAESTRQRNGEWSDVIETACFMHGAQLLRLCAT